MSSPLDEAAEQFEKLLPPMDTPPPPAPEPSENASETSAASDATPPGESEAPPPPCRRLEHGKHGYDLELTVGPDKVIDAVRIMDRGGFGIDMVSGVDWPDDGQMEVIYDFYHPQGPFRVAVRSRIPRDNPVIPTISQIFPGALWHERETHEFYGIDFAGHPNLTHLLLPEDMEGYPLRKDFIMLRDETLTPVAPQTPPLTQPNAKR